jgi:hypothetical protein
MDVSSSRGILDRPRRNCPVPPKLPAGDTMMKHVGQHSIFDWVTMAFLATIKAGGRHCRPPFKHWGGDLPFFSLLGNDEADMYSLSRPR